MNVVTNKKLLKEAINSGCKTAAELALYVKIRANMQTVVCKYLKINLVK